MQDSEYILTELKQLGAEVLITTGNKNCFSVPADYFTGFADTVMVHVFIKSLPSKNPYTVPAGYFDNLSDGILSKINMPENFLLSGYNEKNIYSVPDGYFNSLADNILKKIKTPSYISVDQELEEIAPLLSKIPRTNVYSVPENYFDNLRSLDAIEDSKPQAKVVSFGSRSRKWINYAAAACIASVLFAGGYLYLNKTVEPTVPPIAKVDIQKKISGLTDAQITDYLNSNNNMSVYTNTDDYQPNMDVQNLLQNVSDEEIQQYLNQDTEIGDNEEGI